MLSTACITIASIVIISGTLVESKLDILTSCTCSGYEVDLECVVSSNVSTTWQGTALEECTGERIILRNSEFRNENGYIISKTCGTSGPVTARAVSVVNETYVSQLTINVSQHLNGSTIECVGSSGIGNIQLLLTTEFPFSSNNITLFNVSKGQATFTWKSYSQSCPSLYYIITSNCGKCPNTTSSNFVTCNMTSLNTLPECTVAVQSVVCGDIIGPISKFGVTLAEVINTPMVKIMYAPGSLVFLWTKFTAALNTFENIPISTHNYTLTYTDLSGRTFCGSATVPACACVDEACNHIFDVSSSTCLNSTAINVTVYASNLLGDGPMSDPATIVFTASLLHDADIRTNLNNCSSCECSNVPVLILSASIGLGVLVIIIISITFSLTVRVLLARAKVEVQRELHLAERNEENETKIYDEIQPVQRASSGEINTQENSAYGNIHT